MELKSIEKTAISEISELQEELKRIQCSKKTAEKLIYKTEKDYIRYYLVNKQSGEIQYISNKDENTLKRYSRERYYLKLEKTIPAQIAGLERILKILRKIKDEKAVYEELPEPIRKFADPQPIRKKEMIERFYRKATESEHNSMDINDRYQTDRGDIVRSKSEKIIADMLYHEGIPFDYEQGVYLRNGDLKFPDFTILNTNNGKIYRWEHFGGMDGEEYRRKNMKKITEYEKSGYVQGINLIMTFETKEAPLDIKHIRKLMEIFLK